MPEDVIKVAYADDHALVRDGICTILNSFPGIEVTIQAANGVELLEKLHNAVVLPDICLIDINMPEMDGFGTIISLKKNWPQLKMLVLTVFDSDLYITRTIRHGAGGYMLKSCQPEQLQEAIVHIHKWGYYYAGANTNILLQQVADKEREMPFISDEERMFLQNACTEKSYTTIAETLGVHQDVVAGHCESIYRKFEMNNRTHLSLLAMQLGIMQIETN